MNNAALEELLSAALSANGAANDVLGTIGMQTEDQVLQSQIAAALEANNAAHHVLCAMVVLIHEAEENERCQHPLTMRQDLGTFGQVGEHWVCAACGFEKGGDE